MYHSRETAEEIGKAVNIFKEKHRFGRPDIKAIQADNEWGAANLLGHLLFACEIMPNVYIDNTQLLIIQQEFEEEHGLVNVELLKEKFWIRTINSHIQIPSVVSSAAKEYERIKDAEPEFFFLLEAKKIAAKKGLMTTHEFTAHFQNYQTTHDLTLSRQRVKEMRWIEEQEDSIKFNNLEYYKPVFDFKQELKFITFFLSKKRTENQLKLERERLLTIHRQHKEFFTATPSIEILIAQKVIVKVEDDYFLHLWACEPDYWRSLTGKIGLFLHNRMKGDHRYPDNKHLFHNWLLKMRFIDALIETPGLMSFSDKKELLDFCVETLLGEEDLAGREKEISRLVLSQRRYDYVALSNESKLHFPDLTEAKNLFELFNLMEECNETHQSDILWHQESRWFVQKMIPMVVFFDDTVESTGLKYPYVRKILEAAMDRPYLLWKTCFFIHHWKSEIIPHLCLDVNLASLAFNLCFIVKPDTALSETQSRDLHADILFRCFDLLLTHVRFLSHNEEAIDEALPVFECLICIAENKWEQYGKDQTIQAAKRAEWMKTLYAGLTEILKNKKTNVTVYKDGLNINEFFYPEILSDLFFQIKKYDSLKSFNDGVVGLSLVKFDLLSLLLELVSDRNYREQLPAKSPIMEVELVRVFLSEYLTAFNTSVADRWNFDEARMAPGVPIWYSHQSGYELIPWERWILLLEDYGMLTDFLTPASLKLRNTDNHYDDYNHFTVEKIRKHLQILFHIHQQVKEHDYKFRQEGFKVDSAITRLELAITDYLSRYSVDDPASGKLDILSDRNERTVFGSHERALIPVIAQSLNTFGEHSKKSIITALIQTDSFTKCLKILEFLSSEADINLIRKQIKNFDVAVYLEEKRYIPEIEIIVIKLAEYEEFIEKAKEALAYWESNVLNRRDNTEYLITQFRIRLLIAYYEADEQTITDLNAPDVTYFSTSKGDEFVPTQTRNFYLGLVKLKNGHPKKAYEIFKQLMNTVRNDKPPVAINRFYAHISWAKNIEDKQEKQKELSDSLVEWEKYEKSIPSRDHILVLEYVQENIWKNKLNVYNELQRDNDFDRLFLSLDRTYQLRQDFFGIRMINLMRRQEYGAAKSFLSLAKKYHHSDEEAMPEFIRTANEKLEDEEDYRRLRKEYLDLITRSPEKLLQILPENLVGKRILQDYILKELCGSANDLLDNVNVVRDIKIEDKYTDLLLMSLQARLRLWGWDVGNSRGGFSASNKRNPGELDFVITAADKERIATCEALILHGKNTRTVSSHAVKTFNYDHRRRLFFVISFYDGKDAGGHWDDYKKNIIPGIKFPVKFPLYKSGTEIKETFTNDSIHAILCEHGNDTRVYHVFVNLNYKI